MTEMRLKIWMNRNKSRFIILIFGLLFLFIFKNYFLDRVIFKKENIIINSFYSDGGNFVSVIKNNNTDAIKIFLEKKLVDVNYVDAKKKSSLLIWALLFKNYSLSKELINRGANVNSISPENGLTALHIAASDGCEDCVEALISKGADPNIRDKVKNYKPLDFAIENKRNNIVKYLSSVTTE